MWFSSYRSAAPSSPSSGGAPLVLFTDTLAGPISGGEGGNGAYLSIYGVNFGTPAGLGTTTKVYIGGVEVANYRHLSQGKAYAKLGIWELCVQVGGLGGPTLGTPLAVKVTVGGVDSNTDNTFTPNPGRVIFVSQSGNDGTAAVNNIALPYRNLQTSGKGGAYAVMQPGDQIVIRGGDWVDQGFDTAWLRFDDSAKQGSAPTGSAGTGWFHFTRYPGPINGNAPEDTHYSTPAGAKGGFHGSNGGRAGTTGDWVCVSNLRIDVDPTAQSDAAPINMQSSVASWRAINNKLGPWPSTIVAPNNAKGAGVSGHATDSKVFGNEILDFECVGASENHGTYCDSPATTSGATNWEVAYNWIHDISGGNLIQFFDNLGAAGAGWPGFTGILVHHNWCENSGKYGINLADDFKAGSIYNNVVIGSKFSGLRVSTPVVVDVTVAYNTFYNNDQVSSGSGNGQVLNSWNPSGTFRVYDNIFAAGPQTISTSTYFDNQGGTNPYDFKRNLWYDNGYGWGSVTSLDSAGLTGNPLFVSAGSDFSLQAGSPAKNQATQAVSFAVVNDFKFVTRPQGATNDIGAFERVGG